MGAILRVEVLLIPCEEDLAVAERTVEGPRLSHDPFRKHGHLAFAEVRGHRLQTKARPNMKVPPQFAWTTNCGFSRRTPEWPIRKESNGADASVVSFMQELALQSYHDFDGALFRTEAGWSVPAGYRSVDAEERAARTRAGMIDLSDRAKVALTGSERVPFLDGLVTPDLKILTPGTSVYALLLNEKSRVLGDLRVYVFPDSLVLDIEAAQKDSVLRILERARVSDDVEFHDMGPAGHIEVLGPNADSTIAAALGVEVRGLARDSFLTVASSRHGSPHIGRVQSTGTIGYTIWSPETSLYDEWEKLSRAGVSPIGRDALELLRIETGIPRFGSEMDENTLALEVAPASALSFTKGCYVGQEIVARGTYVGQVRRKLLGLRVDGDLAPVHGDRVSSDGREVGFVTSAAWSPSLGRVVALAILRLDAVSPQAMLFIDRGGWALRGRLSPLPFL